MSSIDPNVRCRTFSDDKEITMDFVSIRVITDDVARLAGFYERATGGQASWSNENFCCAGNCGLAGERYGAGRLASPRDLGLRVLPGRRVPSSSRSSSTGGRPARSIFLRTWPSSLAMKTPPTPVKPVWS